MSVCGEAHVLPSECTVLAARTSLPSHPRRLPPTPLQQPAKVPANTKSPVVKWNPGQVDVLLSAVDRRPDGGALSIADFTELGQSMTPKRTWQSCKQKWYAMYLHKRPRGNGFGSTGDQDGLSKLPAAPTSGGSHALSLSPPSSTVVNRGDDRFTPYSYTPRPEATETLVSIDEQPFSAADDNAMLEMNARWPTGAYKRIARSLEPPRHKGEVRERLREL